jgi:hypothetical protein
VNELGLWDAFLDAFLELCGLDEYLYACMEYIYITIALD